LESAPREGRAALRKLCELKISRVSKPTLKMSEGVLIGDEVNAPVLAIGVERSDLFGRQRAGILPDLAMILIGEGVFNIELKVVIFELRKIIDKSVKRLHRRNFVPAHIQHDPPDRKVRGIVDFAKR
jgi:hydrogenase maturation factor HypE